mmetsp:Transcript_36097/g.107987  ORF Transcript_36097/g.107987 Transcript_36097/m.107987 type:complete len:254 (+) Transcript_36097:269-1030(+)
MRGSGHEPVPPDSGILGLRIEIGHRYHQDVEPSRIHPIGDFGGRARLRRSISAQDVRGIVRGRQVQGRRVLRSSLGIRRLSRRREGRDGERVVRAVRRGELRVHVQRRNVSMVTFLLAQSEVAVASFSVLCPAAMEMMTNEPPACMVCPPLLLVQIWRREGRNGDRGVPRREPRIQPSDGASHRRRASLRRGGRVRPPPRRPVPPREGGAQLLARGGERREGPSGRDSQPAALRRRGVVVRGRPPGGAGRRER